jgi:hypothetical protein
MAAGECDSSVAYPLTYLPSNADIPVCAQSMPGFDKLFIAEMLFQLVIDSLRVGSSFGPLRHQLSLQQVIGREFGQRCAMMFFDMNDASDIPGIVEPLFAGLNARVQLLPVMNAEDLKKGLNIAKRAM